MTTCNCTQQRVYCYVNTYKTIKKSFSLVLSIYRLGGINKIDALLRI